VINTPLDETTGDITPDGLYMTYGSNKDLYWVGTGFIDSLRYTNYVPYVLNSIPDQIAHKGEWFTFTISDSTFFDDDGNNTLAFNARLTNGNPLPSWMNFDTITGTFTGVPEELGTLNIRVTATDTAGAAASANFKLKVQNPVSSPTDTGLNQEIHIFPNPVKEAITIHVGSNHAKPVTAELCNMQGQILQSCLFETCLRLDLTHYARGIYFIRLKMDHETTVRKICLQ